MYEKSEDKLTTPSKIAISIVSILLGIAILFGIMTLFI